MSNESDNKAVVPVSPTGTALSSTTQRLLALAGRASSEITRPNIYFGFDATASRESTWASATQMQQETVEFLGNAGEVAPNMRVAYFKGARKFEAVGWTHDLEPVQRWMQSVTCESGGTQINRILKDANEQIDKGIVIASMMFVGDCCEDDARALFAQAKRIGEAGTPINIQHEVHRTNKLTSTEREAERVFRRIARESGGEYIAFDHDKHQDMKEVTQVIVARAYGPNSRATRKLIEGQKKLGATARTLLLSGPQPPR